MVQDNSKNSDDPHKIYEIINTGCKAILIRTFPVCVYGLNANVSSFVCRQLRKPADAVLPGGFRHDSKHVQLS